MKFSAWFAAFVMTVLVGGPLEGADTSKPASVVPKVLPMGVYRGVNETEKVTAFGQWTGQPVWGQDFIGWESWSNVGWPIWWLEKWSKWVHEQPGRRFVFAVPMLTGPLDGSGPKKGDVGVGEPVSLEKGAAGVYNIHYQQLAENLVKHKLGDTILRPGWEFNGNWYPWMAKGKEEAFAEYWRQIVKTMRAVPGAEKLKFCWNPTLRLEQFPAEKAWPGAEYVDYIGLDVYDESWQEGSYAWPAGTPATEIEARQRKVWEKEILNGDHGLAFWGKFAREQKRPLAICEWGVKKRPTGHGGTDNPHFVEQMHRFMNDAQNNVAFHCYFDFNCEPPDGHHQISPGVKGEYEFPKSSVKFLELFGKKGK